MIIWTSHSRAMYGVHDKCGKCHYLGNSDGVDVWWCKGASKRRKETVLIIQRTRIDAVHVWEWKNFSNEIKAKLASLKLIGV